MFGDWAWLAHRSDQQEHRLRQFLNTHDNPVVVELGAGVAIPTVRHFGEQFAPRLIRINPRDDSIPKGAISLATNAMAGMDQIWQALN